MPTSTSCTTVSLIPDVVSFGTSGGALARGTAALKIVLAVNKASLSGGFILQFSIHSYFRNSAEEFYPHETLSTPIKLVSSLFIKTVPY